MLPLFYEYVLKDVHLLTYNHVNNYQEIINDILIIHRYLLPILIKQKQKNQIRKFCLL